MRLSDTCLQHSPSVRLRFRLLARLKIDLIQWLPPRCLFNAPLLFSHPRDPLLLLLLLHDDLAVLQKREIIAAPSLFLMRRLYCLSFVSLLTPHRRQHTSDPADLPCTLLNPLALLLFSVILRYTESCVRTDSRVVQAATISNIGAYSFLR